MKPKMIKMADAKEIAEACDAVAQKAINWRARALAAEDSLSKFAADLYRLQRDIGDWARKLREASDNCSGHEPSLSVLIRTVDEAANALAAQAMEAPRVETGTGSVHDSAVHAPERPPQNA